MKNIKLLIVGLLASLFLCSFVKGQVLDANGWTSYPNASDSRTIYVSQSGNDANDGLSVVSPKRTLANAWGLIRDGFSDRMRLRRGDVWNERLPSLQKSGRSVSEPIVVEAYGDIALDRPKMIVGSAEDTAGIYCLARTIRNVSYLSLDFDSNFYRPSSFGIWFLAPDCSNILVEDCRFSNFLTGVALQGYNASQHLGSFTLRRCQILNNFTYSHSQGIYAYSITGLTVEECLFDGNGWNAVVGIEDTIFAHNMYFHKNVNNFIVKNNIVARGSSNGISTGTGGVIDGNLIVDHPLGIVARPAGTVVKNNILVGTRAIAGSPRGFGIICQGQWGVEDADGPTPMGSFSLTDNLIIHSAQAWDNPSIQLIYTPQATNNIVYKWETQANTAEKFHNGSWVNVPVSTFAAPTRTLKTYSASLGNPATTEGFMVVARSLRKGNSNSAYTAQSACQWIRAGYGGPLPSIADMNNDGAVTIDDLLIFLSGFEDGDAGVADINGDAGVDINDLLMFLEAFERG